MNVIFNKDKDTGNKYTNFRKFLDKQERQYLVIGIAVSLFVLGLFLFWVHLVLTNDYSPQAVQEPVETVESIELVVESVASSYGVPVGPMVRLAYYLQDNDFNGRYGGVGLYSVRPSHLDWIKDNVLKETTLDLENALQNAQVAATLLKRFNDAGYNWKACFLVYVYGFSALNEIEKYNTFMEAIFPDG